MLLFSLSLSLSLSLSVVLTLSQLTIGLCRSQRHITMTRSPFWKHRSIVTCQYRAYSSVRHVLVIVYRLHLWTK